MHIKVSVGAGGERVGTSVEYILLWGGFGALWEQDNKPIRICPESPSLFVIFMDVTSTRSKGEAKCPAVGPLV